MQFLYIDGGGPVEVTFQGVTALETLPSASFAGINFGPVRGGRKIIVAVHLGGNSGTNPDLVSGVIGGVAATVFVGDTRSPGGLSAGDNGIWWMGASVPTGTSGTISITASSSGGASGGAVIAVWTIVNAINLTPTDTDVTTFGSTSNQTVNTDCLAGGVHFAAARAFHVDGVTLSGVTPDYSQRIVGGSDVRITGGFALTPSDVANKTATLSQSGGTNMNGALAAVSLR